MVSDRGHAANGSGFLLPGFVRIGDRRPGGPHSSGEYLNSYEWAAGCSLRSKGDEDVTPLVALAIIPFGLDIVGPHRRTKSKLKPWRTRTGRCDAFNADIA
eukprot:scaffold60507_cov38-Prasinocladus_malaysianus.AAC.1